MLFRSLSHAIPYSPPVDSQRTRQLANGTRHPQHDAIDAVCGDYSPCYPHRHRGQCIGYRICGQEEPMCYGQSVPLPDCVCPRCDGRMGCHAWEAHVIEEPHFFIDASGIRCEEPARVWPGAVSCDSCAHDGTGWLCCPACLLASATSPGQPILMTTVDQPGMRSLIASGLRPGVFRR